MLEAPAGQQISVSLLDFGLQTREKNCLQFGYIVDKAANKNVSICGLFDERKNTIHKSVSNHITIVLTEMNIDSSKERVFLIGFTGLNNWLQILQRQL